MTDHLVSMLLMRDNTMNGQLMGDVPRTSACGLTHAAWQGVGDDAPTPVEYNPDRICGNCARTRRFKQWMSDYGGDET